MFLFFLGLLIKLGERADSKLIRVIADTSFGVFFIHSYVLTASKLTIEQTLGAKISGSLLVYPIVTIAILMLSVGIIVVLQKLLSHKSRYLVGS